MKLNFHRSTLSTQFIAEIDGLRFFAIFTVVLFHLNTAFSREIGMGADLGMAALGGRSHLWQAGWWMVRLDLGVKVFFAISGMVLALPFLKYHLKPGSRPVKLQEYFIRRLTRLEPPFIISLLVFTLVHLFVLHTGWNELAGHFWAGLCYAHVFVFGMPNPINPVTWSLETEAQFYLVVPALFAMVMLIKNTKFRVASIVLFFLLFLFLKGFLLKNHYNHLTGSLLAYMVNFLTGIFFAYVYVTRQSWFAKRTLVWDLVGIASILMLFVFYKPQAWWVNNLLFNIGIFGMMTATFKGKMMNGFFTHKIIYQVGGMCYSIYLIHYAFFHLAVKYTSVLASGMNYKIGLAVQFLVAVPLLMIVSAIFFLLIEKPCMDKKWPSKIIAFFKPSRQKLPG